MANTKSLQDKVIIVTGAGRGIGREIALLCAAEGAKVVVNDPGGAADGSGTSAAPAEEVVDEIKKRGGTAVANFETVAEAIPASKIVKMAVDTYGKLDGVVNNAGILRDAIFHRMSIDAFESVIKVHLMGSFYVAHAAARLFREQESGSFVHFTSTSGLVGNFGQANYAAAKLGIVGLSKSIALDMNRFNVRSNCVSPFAWSRLIGTIPTETEAEKARVAKIQQMGPEKIAPICAFLLSDAAKDVTGQIFAVRMNEIFLMSQSRPLRSIHRAEGWTPQTLAEHGIPASRSVSSGRTPGPIIRGVHCCGRSLASAPNRDGTAYGCRPSPGRRECSTLFALSPAISSCFCKNPPALCRIVGAEFPPNKKILGGHHDKSIKFARPSIRGHQWWFRSP
jgi:NAD(P)-dependent dehydrogenase (short-subunit alcohol dehydrogenase family)